MRRSSSNGSSISSSSTRDLSMCDLFKVLIGPMGDGRRNVENVTMVTTRYLLSATCVTRMEMLDLSRQK